MTEKLTNESNCPISDKCKVAGHLPQCTEDCVPFISVMARFKAAGIPIDYQDIFLDNSPAKEEQSDIYNALNAYVESFSKDDVRVKSIYLFSTNPGTGKTTTASALLNEYIKRRFHYYIKRGEQVPSTLGLFIDINQLQMRYNLAAMTNNQDELEEIKRDLRKISEVEFAVLDDVGVRKDASESFRSLVHSVVNERITNHRPTVYTSNLPINDMRRVFDDRLGDRISDMTAEFTFKGQSKRGVR